MDNSPNVDPGPILAIVGIWSLVGIAYYVWYLWSLSRLFPKLGLPSWAGWVPLWNQWQLIQRGGLPGWLVLLGLIPGLGVVVLIVTIIAINRINAEHGKGAGFTVLGVFIPPLWAMLLTNDIGDSGYSGYSDASGQRYGADPGHDPYQSYQPGAGYQPTPQSYQQPVTNGWQPVPSLQQAGQAAPVAQQYAPPVTVPPAPVQQVPFPPAQAVPQVQAAPVAPVSAGRVPIAPVPAAPGQPQPANAWGFSNTTEGAFERLASEQQTPRAAAPLGATIPPQPFSWPESQEELDAQQQFDAQQQQLDAQQAREGDAARSRVARSEPIVLPDPPGGPTIFDRPQEPASEAREAPRAAPAAAVPPAPDAHVPAAPAGHVPPVPAGSAPAAPAPAASAPAAPAAPAVPAPAASYVPAPTATPVTSTEPVAVPPVPPASPTVQTAATASATPSAPSDEDVDADSDDRTVIVTRRVRWGLELPDGEVLELEGDDVVIGRKPEPADGASVLQIVDPTRTMSKTHARMRRHDDDWTIEDLQSTNGVALVDERGETVSLEAGREYEVTDQLVIGTLGVHLRRIG